MIKLDFLRDEHAYVPGDAIEGTVTWREIDAGQTATAIDVRLFWHTAGKGTMDLDIVASMTIEAPTRDGSQKFRFIAPHRPNSFSGKLISLIWSVEAIVFPSKETERQEITISKTGQEILILKLEQDSVSADELSK